MNDVNTTAQTEEISINTEPQVTPTSTNKETNMTTSTTPNVIRTADLSAADKKTLLRLFGVLPDAKALTIQGRKGSVKTQPECECGCGKVCPSPFLSGHDASLKSALNAVAKGDEPSCTEGRGSAARGFSKPKAAAELARRGW